MSRESIANVVEDARDDWLPDPWNQIELRWLARQPRVRIEEIALGAIARPVHLAITVNRVRRLATILSAGSRLAYQAAIDRVSSALLAQLEQHAYGWRVSRTRPTDGLYASQVTEGRGCMRALEALTSERHVLLQLDVKALYRSLTFERLMAMVGSSGADRWQWCPVERVLDAFCDTSGRALVLPQNHLPSSVLANAYLSTALSNARERGPDVAIVRWMDDMWIGAASERAALRCADGISTALESVGLELNNAKASLFEGGELAAYLAGMAMHRVKRVLPWGNGAEWPPFEPWRWSGVECRSTVEIREMCRVLLPALECPHLVRSAALAAWMVGEETRWLRQVLRDRPSDTLIRAFFDAVESRPAPSHSSRCGQLGDSIGSRELGAATRQGRREWCARPRVAPA